MISGNYVLTGRVSDDSPALLDAGRLVQRVQQIPDFDVFAELKKFKTSYGKWRLMETNGGQQCCRSTVVEHTSHDPDAVSSIPIWWWD